MILVKSIASWAKDAMITRVEAGIISGGDGKSRWKIHGLELESLLQLLAFCA
jgi:hypothetical protein